MSRGNEKVRIGILAYPGAQISAVHGLTDLLETANRLSLREDADGAELAVGRWAVDEGTLCPTKPQRPLSALVLPPSLSGLPEEAVMQSLAAWISARRSEGTLLCSVCAGAFLLAETGVLAGRPATTHWALAERFAERFPEVILDADKLIIDDGDVITAGGLMAWVDLGLRLVDRFLGTTAMLATARYFLVDPAGREQRFYSAFAPRLNHGDGAVLKTQHWLQTKSGEKVTLPMMAARAGLGERTFLRRFVKATGHKPTEYLQHLRVGKAREMLELTALSIDQIAWRVGYEDPGAFRRVFHRLMGLTPGEYRRRFAVAGSG